VSRVGRYTLHLTGVTAAAGRARPGLPVELHAAGREISAAMPGGERLGLLPPESFVHAAIARGERVRARVLESGAGVVVLEIGIGAEAAAMPASPPPVAPSAGPPPAGNAPPPVVVERIVTVVQSGPNSFQSCIGCLLGLVIAFLILVFLAAG